MRYRGLIAIGILAFGATVHAESLPSGKTEELRQMLLTVCLAQSGNNRYFQELSQQAGHQVAPEYCECYARRISGAVSPNDMKGNALGAALKDKASQAATECLRPYGDLTSKR